jgi:hypothetical protein
MITTIALPLGTFVLGYYVGHHRANVRAEREREELMDRLKTPMRCGTPLLMKDEIRDFLRRNDPTR